METMMLLEPILVLLGGLFLGWLARQIDDGDAHVE